MRTVVFLLQSVSSWSLRNGRHRSSDNDSTRYLNWQMQAVALLVFLATSRVSFASGVPGDGLADFYYFGSNSGPATTSIGEIERPVGTLLLDTDGADIVAIIVGGDDVVTNAPDDGNHLTGGTEFLPDPTTGRLITRHGRLDIVMEEAIGSKQVHLEHRDSSE